MTSLPTKPLSRRSFLAALSCAGLAGAGFVLPSGARAQSDPSAFPPGFSSFVVDAGPLRAKGLGPFADLVADAALDALRRSFADRVDPRGPRLVVRLTNVFLTTSTGGGGDRWWGGGGGGSDSLEGEALAVGPRGEILARKPQLAALPARRPSYDPDEPGRAVALAQHYVGWLRRSL